MSSWYEAVEDTALRQGDIVADVPVVRADAMENWPPEEGAQLPVAVDIEDRAIVVSQSCDLANDKIPDVLLAQVADWQTACAAMIKAGNQFAQGKKFRKALVEGHIPSLHLLHKHGEPELSWSIVDFHRLFVVPKALVVDCARRQGKRLRLCPPYREHFAQAFARYFMRVGLPLDARAFESEGAPQAEG
jgi:hypothetical protein